MYEFFKNHPRRGVLRNGNLSNLENVLQRNVRTDRAGDCIFKASGGTDFEHFSAKCQPLWRLRGFDVPSFNGLPKTPLYTSPMTD